MSSHLVDLVNTLIQKTSHLREMTDDVMHKFVVGTLKFAMSLHQDCGFVIQKIRSKCVDFYGEFAKDPDQKAEDKLRNYACAEMTSLLSLAGFSKNELNISMEIHYFPRDIYDKIIEHWDFYHHTMHLQKSKTKSFMSQDLIHKGTERERERERSSLYPLHSHSEPVKWDGPLEDDKHLGWPNNRDDLMICLITIFNYCHLDY